MIELLDILYAIQKIQPKVYSCWIRNQEGEYQRCWVYEDEADKIIIDDKMYYTFLQKYIDANASSNVNGANWEINWYQRCLLEKRFRALGKAFWEALPSARIFMKQRG